MGNSLDDAYLLGGEKIYGRAADTDALTELMTVDSSGYVQIGEGLTGVDIRNTMRKDGTTITSSAAELNILTGVNATAAEINAAADISAGAAVAANGDTLTVTAATHAGKIIQFGKTDGTTVTLPAATGTGHIYRFVIGVTATSAANIIKVANATDVMDGSLNIQQDTDTDGNVKVWRADAGDDTMTFAGAATTGGILGGYIECVDYKAGYWSCRAFTQSGGGSEATPFSASVS